ncbi:MULTISPECIES: hypothetical protein [unclassified Kitasatospora]|uniref:hypothetical protein n=1 Tax=unclassified Kitasatospora TaxID=2633591 RepID=UPI00070D4228|nr:MULTISPECIES: hypothetical protein [unclassified Kitasatospora]KQV15449.1 hypothetical protein ASC99_07580 [Kitasatospora sp. Root107]KRB63963.1 hypothetical protein ASE03_05285 [Kitasatospora sp. Root187]
MRATVFGRIEKNVTVATNWTRRGRGLAVTVPLAAVLAVGLVGCGGGAAGPKAAPVADLVSPLASPSTSPVVTPTVAPSPSATVPSTPPAQPAAVVSAKPSAPVAPMAKEVVATFLGLPQGSQVQVGGPEVSFQVKWTNNTKTRQAKVAPAVSAMAYEGNPCNVVMPMVEGTLQRKDPGGWVKLPSLSQGTGMDHAGTGEAAAFALGPGESRTIQYRMQLAPTNGTGTLRLQAQAFDGPTLHSTFARLGAATVAKVAVVDKRRPTAVLVGRPTTPVAGQSKQFELEIGNPTGTTMAKAAPTLHVMDPRENAAPLGIGQVVFEVKDGAGWHRLPNEEGCGGWIAVVTEELTHPLAPGAKKRYTFRVTTVGRGNAGLEYTVGAIGDAHPSAAEKF